MQLHHASALVPINQLLNTFNQAYLAPHFASEPDTISIISNPNSDPNFYCGSYFRTKLCVRFSVDFFLQKRDANLALPTKKQGDAAQSLPHSPCQSCRSAKS